VTARPVARSIIRSVALAALAASAFIAAAPHASAQSFASTEPDCYPSAVFAPVLRDDTATDTAQPARFRRQVIDYPSREAAGTIVIDTPNTYLYLVLGGDKALRYGIGVGREGFTWSGVETISRTAEWPDWYPPAEMIARQPYLPRFMAGGPGNPLGARALYLGNTQYRIHGTNDPTTIGHQVSSGCIRLTNEDIADLFGRVHTGTRVVVLPQTHRVPTARATTTAVIRVSVAGPRADAGLAYGIH
jgi:lipoprotein-anchoring transpeptidase ErfK/SrfK